MSEAPQWWHQRMPDAPVSEPWDCSAAALLGPRLPAKLRRLPGLLDRFGAIRLTPSTIGVDKVRELPWSRVTEIRTCPVGQVAAELTKDLAGRAAGLVAVPGFATRVVVAPVVDLVTGLLRTAIRESGEGAQVPRRICYRARWKSVDLSPGLVSSAVFCLPQVSASVILTARQHGIPISALQGGSR